VTATSPPRPRSSGGAPANLQAVFVHAWWRSASTWLWAKLRDLPGLRCYYEPLHERFAVLTAETLRAQRVDPARLRRGGHPVLNRPYFAEYLELLEAGGAGFQRELSYERYFLAPGEDDAALERYLQALIAHAERAGERPVLCFVRSPLRALWMRRRFAALHLAQIRNPRDQWGSFLAQGGERSYFTAGMRHIARRLQRRVPRLLSHLPALRPGPERRYAAFTLLWLASALQSLSAADFVLDSDLLSVDLAARSRATARLAAEGLRADLSDAAVARHPELPLDAAALRALEALAVRQLAGDARELALFDATRVTSVLEDLSPPSRELLQRALAALA